MSKCGKSLKVTDLKLVQWIYNIAAGTLDEGVNIILGGSRNETISARLGRANLPQHKPKWYAYLGYRGVNCLFFWQDDHCMTALDLEDNVDDEVWTWYVIRASI